MFRTKYSGTWFPTSVRLTLGSMGGAYPSEAWVDDILLIARTVGQGRVRDYLPHLHPTQPCLCSCLSSS
jgi:hypothetical protein